MGARMTYCVFQKPRPRTVGYIRQMPPGCEDASRQENNNITPFVARVPPSHPRSTHSTMPDLAQAQELYKSGMVLYGKSRYEEALSAFNRVCTPRRDEHDPSLSGHC